MQNTVYLVPNTAKHIRLKCKTISVIIIDHSSMISLVLKYDHLTNICPPQCGQTASNLKGMDFGVCCGVLHWDVGSRSFGSCGTASRRCSIKLRSGEFGVWINASGSLSFSSSCACLGIFFSIFQLHAALERDGTSYSFHLSALLLLWMIV